MWPEDKGEARWVRPWVTGLSALCLTHGHTDTVPYVYPSQSQFADLFDSDETSPAIKRLEEGGLFLNCSHHFDEQQEEGGALSMWSLCLKSLKDVAWREHWA